MGYEDVLQDIPVSEYQGRLKKTKERMEKEGLEAGWILMTKKHRIY